MGTESLVSIYWWCYLTDAILIHVNRYHQKAPTSWSEITFAFLLFVICILVGYILYGAGIHIVKVEDDFHEMQELKVRAEAADVAKSQVSTFPKLCSAFKSQAIEL